MQRKLTGGAIAAVRQAVQKCEQLRLPDYIAVAVRATTDERGQPVVMISRSKKSASEQ